MSQCRRPGGFGPSDPSRSFDLTSCFEDVVLSSIYALFIVAGVLKVGLLLYKRRDKLSRGTRSALLLYAKQILIALAVVGSVFNLVVVTSVRSPKDVIELLYVALQPLAFITVFILTYQEHKRTRISSSVLLILYPIYLLATAIRLRTIATTTYIRGSVLFGFNVAIPSLILVAYVLECFGPEIRDNRIQLEMLDKENPIATANIYTRWTFGWITPLMKLGASKFITESDLDELLPRDKSAQLGRDLYNAIQKHPYSLWIALFRAYGGPFAVAAGLKIIQDLLAFLQPQLLRWLLSFIGSYQGSRIRRASPPDALQGFVVALLMFVAGVAQSVILHQYFQICFTTGMRVRAGLVTSIYRKALVLSGDERGDRASGDIVNLMSVDAARLQDLCGYGLIAISGPLQITLAFVSLYNLLGWPAFVGVAIMVFSVPINTFIARYLMRLQKEQMKNRDERTRLMSELLANIKSVKLYAWEPAFIRKILGVRNDRELKMLRKIGITTALSSTLWSGIPLLVAFSSFAVAAVTKSSSMTPDVIFPAISLFMLLQFPLSMFSQVTSNVIEAMVSVKRLSSFLHANELQVDARICAIPPGRMNEGDDVLVIKDGEFAWSAKAKEATLYDINIQVKKGQLYGVLGRVGCGKSSLLSAVIGEMTRTAGSVNITGSIAYAPQNPWIQSTTVRENILFSHEYDETFYELVVDACALRDDLALLPDGDMTEVGEKGITLSGGQRARIALARAVYARADLYLLDDVLSAVDSHVARHVFDRVIGPRGILSTKARVFVTHSVAFCSQFDSMCYLRKGTILEYGTFAELMADSESQTLRLVSGYGGSTTPKRASGSTTPRVDDDATLVMRSSPTSDEKEIGNYGLTEKEVDETLYEKLNRRQSFRRAVLAKNAGSAPSEGISVSRKEHSEQGSVKRDVYMEYIKAVSVWGFALYFFTVVSAQITSVLGNFVLRAWGDRNQLEGKPSEVSKYLLDYGLVSLCSIFFSATGSILIFVTCTLRSAKSLHDRMLFSVMRSPLSFFEMTPLGRILNLFSRDIYVVDSILGRVIQALFRSLVQVLGIVVVIGSSFPLFLMTILPLGYFYYLIMIYYLNTSRELKRLDAVSKSPIFAWFSESLTGLSTIRGFNQQGIFIVGNEKRLDRNQMCYLPSISCNRWLALRLEFIGALIILVTALFSLWALVTTGVDAGLVGLVLSYGLNVTTALNWTVRSGSEVETNLVSVERILHYVRLASEAADEIPDNQPEQPWPSDGVVQFVDYSMRYRPDLDLVLKNISMTLRSSEKVGVCGRTGAGKSSLLLALFRIIEPATGTIFIDGVDITKIGLRDLRSAVSIIPQEPQLFEGTLRENVDPTSQYDDASIWAALTQSHLREYVESLEGGLDALVREGGSSMSAGQRQLLCFARALLRKTKILVLDEATSAVDLDTDNAIQEIIRGSQFAGVTMLTIAHRLNTIMGYDRVLVLDAGEIAEFDTPRDLLARKESKFYGLAAEAGLVD